jgi:hypothetical protein
MSSIDTNSIINSLRQELSLKLEEMIEEIQEILEEKIQDAVENIQDEINNGDHDSTAPIIGRELTQAEILLAEQRKIERELGL